MQYSIPLPTNIDAAAIRARVASRRALFDDHAGLLHKSFIYSENDHLYAPFYVWKQAAEARNFLLDDLFKGVVDTFRRHRVRCWVVAGMVQGDLSLAPTFARRETDPIDPERPLKAMYAEELAAQAECEGIPGLYMHLVALDADRWEWMRYSLWRDAAAAPQCRADCVQTYEVLHISAPRP